MVMEWSPVLGTVREFINYSLFIAGILAIYYFIKFWTIGGKTSEDKDKDSEAFRKWVKDKLEAKKAAKKTREEKEKKEKEKKHKKDLVSPIKENMVDAIEACSDVTKYLAHSDPIAAKNSAENLINHLESAWANLRLLRRKLEREEREKVHDLITQIEIARENYADNLKGKIKDPIDPATIPTIKNAINDDKTGIKYICSLILQRLEEFHE